MGINNFNYRQCVRALKKLGFQISTIRQGKHDKFIPPPSLFKSNQSFIMIPRHKVLHCQNEIIKELRQIGNDQLVEQFRQYL